MMQPLLRQDDYETAQRRFAWNLPERMNLARQVCDDWADAEPERVAILDMGQGAATPSPVTYGALRKLSARVQAALLAKGVVRGDRVGVLLSQSPLTAAAHIAAWRMGAISVPLFTLFRREALATRLEDSDARIVITDAVGAEMLSAFDLDLVLAEDLPAEGASDCAGTGPNDPAILIYTSGTTGAPKGALHGHRVLTGHLPGVEMFMGRPPRPDDVFWTPADWAWIGGLFNVAMPALALGCPVVAARPAKFTPEIADAICRAARVRCVFFPPTVLRMLKAANARIEGLRAVGSGGEPLGAEMLAWGREALGLTINEFYGQTECNLVASSCSEMFEPTPGTIGRAVPGHEVAVIDPDGAAATGEGDIAVRRGSAAMMLEYWQRPEATAEKFRGDWMLTGDRGRWEGAYLRFVGREDDVISSGGYRIGPAEIEDCLMTHPDVATVGVVGKPDPVRGEIVKAYVVRTPDAAVDAVGLQAWVKERLAAYSYPREIEFLEALPMTVTGKVIRGALKKRAAAERS